MKKALYIIMIVVLFLFLLGVLMPFAVIVFENIFVMFDIDNPYVSHFYAGWQPFSVEGFSSFYLPAEWSVQNDDALYTIIDDSGAIWAYGFTGGTDNDRFDSYKDFIQEVYSIDSADVSVDPFIPFVMMDGSDIDKLIVQEGTTTNEYYCIQMLQDTQTELYWVLTKDISSNAAQYDIAEAIVYSFAFDVGQ